MPSHRDGFIEFRYVATRSEMRDFCAAQNAIIEAHNQNRLSDGPGIRLIRTQRGTLPTIRQNLANDDGGASSYPWRIQNTTTGTTGQVQLFGTDGPGSQLNGFVCNVNSNPSDTLISGAYPQLAITGNGVVYGYAIPTTAGTASPLTSLDLFYAGTLPSVDVANPATYFPMLVATISNYATDGSGNVSFDMNNAYGSGYGPSTLFYCAGVLGVY